MTVTTLRAPPPQSVSGSAKPPQLCFGLPYGELTPMQPRCWPVRLRLSFCVRLSASASLFSLSLPPSSLFLDLSLALIPRSGALGRRTTLHTRERGDGRHRPHPPRARLQPLKRRARVSTGPPCLPLLPVDVADADGRRYISDVRLNQHRLTQQQRRAAHWVKRLTRATGGQRKQPGGVRHTHTPLLLLLPPLTSRHLPPLPRALRH